jgi:hypothetical protein
MSSGKVHVLGGIAVWLVAFVVMWPQLSAQPMERLASFAAASFFVCFLGSLLPDTDTPKSNIGGVLQFTVFLAGLSFGIMRFFSMSDAVTGTINAVITAIAVLFIFLLLRPKHRGATHTIKASVAYALIVFLFFFLGAGLSEASFFSVIAFASYFSHLALDTQFTWG